MSSPSPPAVLVVSLPPTPSPPASASHAITRSALIVLGIICFVAAASLAINYLLRRHASRRSAYPEVIPVTHPLPAPAPLPLPLPRSGPAPARWAPAALAAADCIVCLSDIVPRAEARLACRHRFHRTCIDEWVRSSPASPTCPLCRAAVQPPRPADAVGPRRTARRSSAAGDRRRVRVDASGEAPPGCSRVPVV